MYTRGFHFIFTTEGENPNICCLASKDKGKGIQMEGSIFSILNLLILFLILNPDPDPTQLLDLSTEIGVQVNIRDTDHDDVSSSTEGILCPVA